MKLLDNDIIMWWREGLIAGGVVLVGFVLFSSLLYQKIIIIANEPVSFLEEERPVRFSPALLDDIKAFWERRGRILTNF